MGVLYAVRLAHRTLSSLINQSVLLAFTIFDRICLIFVLDTSTCPLDWVWYGVATLCRTPYFSNNPLKNLLQKWDPTSLLIALGVPNIENMFFFENVVTLFPSLLASSMA